MSIMEDSGDTREDIKLPEYPETLEQEIRADFEAGKLLVVTVLKACGVEQIISKKEDVGST